MAELATAAAPGVMMLGQGPLGLFQAEWVERVTADLAEHQLGAGTVNDGHSESPEDEILRAQESGSKGHWGLGAMEKGGDPTSCRPLLAHSKHTIGGPPGTEVSTLRPPISHTFSRSQSS